MLIRLRILLGIWGNSQSKILKKKYVDAYLLESLKKRVFSEILEGQFRDCADYYRHAARVAYLVVYGKSYKKIQDAIEIDVGCPAFGHSTRWIVEDGNHRLAAAIYRNDRHIYANIQGQISHAEKLFRVKIKE